mmetsp:Transcript_25185/g.30431  ORF Transcript_25185/g.30431 Transcript_25185/m.30431 type:complete len:981 (+) Transcript_25185:49-2991(+)|eukprot:CAMPEP_0172511266 /NCGR_PEP_ID=MMETSP1066-20121228/235109_1 /TAXON_ID=671091 /ORGANISM="Coscinodiscus wailesii, Strain CCMP2513" /LENGTH=980 /DNA_ID=CAMNT_0013290575 /DNA_START=48 /DNA_END=2990 /DNA_ORIENTATION=+
MFTPTLIAICLTIGRYGKLSQLRSPGKHGDAHIHSDTSLAAGVGPLGYKSGDSDDNEALFIGTENDSILQDSSIRDLNNAAENFSAEINGVFDNMKPNHHNVNSKNEVAISDIMAPSGALPPRRNRNRNLGTHKHNQNGLKITEIMPRPPKLSSRNTNDVKEKTSNNADGTYDDEVVSVIQETREILKKADERELNGKIKNGSATFSPRDTETGGDDVISAIKETLKKADERELHHNEISMDVDNSIPDILATAFSGAGIGFLTGIVISSALGLDASANPDLQSLPPTLLSLVFGATCLVQASQPTQAGQFFRDTFGGMTKSLLQSLSKASSSAMTSATENLKSLPGHIAESAKSSLTHSLEKLSVETRAMPGKVKGSVEKSVNELQSEVNAIPQKVQKKLKSDVQKVQTDLSHKTENFVTDVKSSPERLSMFVNSGILSVQKSALEYLEAVPKDVQFKTSGLVNGIETSVKSVPSTLSRKVEAAIQEARGVPLQIQSSIAEKTKVIIEDIQQTPSIMAQNVEKKVLAASASVKKTPKNVVSDFEKKLSEARKNQEAEIKQREEQTRKAYAAAAAAAKMAIRATEMKKVQEEAAQKLRKLENERIKAIKKASSEEELILLQAAIEKATKKRKEVEVTKKAVEVVAQKAADIEQKKVSEAKASELKLNQLRTKAKMTDVLIWKPQKEPEKVLQDAQSPGFFSLDSFARFTADDVVWRAGIGSNVIIKDNLENVRLAQAENTPLDVNLTPAIKQQERDAKRKVAAEAAEKKRQAVAEKREKERQEAEARRQALEQAREMEWQKMEARKAAAIAKLTEARKTVFNKRKAKEEAGEVELHKKIGARKIAALEKATKAREAASAKRREAEAKRSAAIKMAEQIRNNKDSRISQQNTKRTTISLFNFLSGTRAPTDDASAVRAPRGVASLCKWKRNRDGSITGYVSNSKHFSNGELITTSPLLNKNVKGGNIVRTASGSKYFLETN